VTRALIFIFFVACKGAQDPEERCAEKCAHATQCSDRECARGCAFVLDRIVEREDNAVLACVARAKCDDPGWAECAAKIGPHADGGPGPPEHLPDMNASSSEDSDE